MNSIVHFFSSYVFIICSFEPIFLGRALRQHGECQLDGKFYNKIMFSGLSTNNEEVDYITHVM